MLLETMVDRGWWLIVVGAKSLSIFCTFKKSAQNQDQNRNKKKETRKSLFFNFIAFVVVCVIFSRVFHL
jgi:hypothetical protein